MSKMKLPLIDVLKASKHLEPGLRSWELSNDVVVYCSAEEGWYDGPLYYKGWSVLIHIGQASHPRLEWVLLKLTIEQARDFLWSKYAKRIEE